MSRRIAKIIEEAHGDPSEILCITFTNKACKEMEERALKILGTGAKHITIKTFHGFCFDVIKKQAKTHTDIFTDFVVFDEEDCKEIIKSCNYYNYPISKLQLFIELVKTEKARRYQFRQNHLIDYKDIIKCLFDNNENKIDSICNNKEHIDITMKEFLKSKGDILVGTYNSLLNINHGLDFIDLTTRTIEIFQSDEVVNSYREKYKYINIDEVQDTSTLEYFIIEKLFKGNNVLMCGDIFQTIYGWRGSEPISIFNRFKEKYNPLEVVFTKNYRATKNLTEASLKFLQKAFPKEMMNFYSNGIESETMELGNKIYFKAEENMRMEARFIFDELRRLENHNIDISKSCVLTRDNKYNIALSRYFEEISRYEGSSFEFLLVDQFKFFRRQEIKDIIAFLKLVVNRQDSLSFKRIASRLPTGVGDKTFESIESKEYSSLGITLTDYLDPNALKYGDKYSVLVDEFNNDNIIIFDVESTGIEMMEDEIIQIAAIKVNRDGQVISTFERFIKNTKSVSESEHIHGFSDEFLRNNGEDKKTVLREFIDFSKDAVIVGHNVQFDISILISELQRINLDKPKFKGVYDTLDIYRRFYPNLINHKLGTLSEVFSTLNKPSHNAMDDILATNELLVRAIKEDIIPTSVKRKLYIEKHIKGFSYISSKLNELFSKAELMRPHEIVVKIINSFNIKSLYTGEEGKSKIERLRDFYVLLKELDDSSKSNRDSLIEVIKITGLSNGDLETLLINRTKKIRIPLITVHQAKGLEFDNVFLAGVSDNTFPSYMSIKSNNLEEEKRTFYVAITRAKKRLYISYNTDGGYFRKNSSSRFLKFIPSEYISKLD